MPLARPPEGPPQLQQRPLWAHRACACRPSPELRLSPRLPHPRSRLCHWQPSCRHRVAPSPCHAPPPAARSAEACRQSCPSASGPPWRASPAAPPRRGGRCRRPPPASSGWAHPRPCRRQHSASPRRPWRPPRQPPPPRGARAWPRVGAFRGPRAALWAPDQRLGSRPSFRAPCHPRASRAPCARRVCAACARPRWRTQRSGGARQ
mmetsp:Transcript_9477/g.38945  ORF Transcript_9477/g.38945 Transcript_9477/m.38945 type:complete len:206 (-) Transcript_9477:1777-2394(-)